MVDASAVAETCILYSADPRVSFVTGMSWNPFRGLTDGMTAYASGCVAKLHRRRPELPSGSMTYGIVDFLDELQESLREQLVKLTENHNVTMGALRSSHTSEAKRTKIRISQTLSRVTSETNRLCECGDKLLDEIFSMLFEPAAVPSGDDAAQLMDAKLEACRDVVIGGHNATGVHATSLRTRIMAHIDGIDSQKIAVQRAMSEISHMGSSFGLSGAGE